MPYRTALRKTRTDAVFFIKKTKDSYQAIRKNHYLCLRFGCGYLAK